MTRAAITALHVYPVKSFAGVSVSRAKAGVCGLSGDRQWAVFNAAGRPLTQRQCPEMALVRPELNDLGLKLTSADGDTIIVSAPPADANPEEVIVWKDPCIAQAASSEVNRWITDVLKSAAPLRLMRAHAAYPRHFIKPERFAVRGQYFSDAAPYLLANVRSLQNLNQALSRAGLTEIDMRHFRPNIVVEGLPAFAEHDFRAATNDDASLRLIDHCQRCSIITVDPDSGTFAVPQLIKLIAGINAMPGAPKAPAFGVNCALSGTSEIELQLGQEFVFS